MDILSKVLANVIVIYCLYTIVKVRVKCKYSSFIIDTIMKNIESVPQKIYDDKKKNPIVKEK